MGDKSISLDKTHELLRETKSYLDVFGELDEARCELLIRAVEALTARLESARELIEECSRDYNHPRLSEWLSQ